MKTILVADDEDFLRLLVVQTLDAYQVFEASDGDRALEMAFQKGPDLILLDWMMPGRDGPAVLDELRKSEATCDIPVIMVTGRVSSEEQHLVLERGANACISKPFSPSELRACVEKLLAEAEG